MKNSISWGAYKSVDEEGYRFPWAGGSPRGGEGSCGIRAP